MRAIVLFAALVICMASVISADDPPKGELTSDERKLLVATWKQWKVAGDKASRSKDHKEAEKAYREELAVAKRLYPMQDHVFVVTALNDLVGVLRIQGKFGEAEPFVGQCQAMEMRLTKPNNLPQQAAALNARAAELTSRKAFAEAEPIYRDVLDIARRLYPNQDHANVAASLSNLAGVLRVEGKFIEAESLYRDLLALTRRLYSSQLDHPAILDALLNLGHTLRGQGKYSEAERCYRDLLELQRRRSSNQLDSTVLETMGTIAAVLRERGKLADAELLSQEQLTLTRRLFKNLDHPKVAASLTDLAGILTHRGKFADAEQICRESLEMNLRLYPKQDHPNVAASMNTLAGVLLQLGKDDAAETQYRAALEMTERLFANQDHPAVAGVLNNLATLLKRNGKYDDAEKLFRAAAEMVKRFYPKQDHPDVARSLHNLASVLWVRGKYAEAELHFRDALKMYRALLMAQAAFGAEGDALTQATAQPQTRDGFLSNARLNRTDPTVVYTEIWADKAAIAREAERRALRARAATNPRAAAILAELRELRYLRAELLLGRMPATAQARAKRDELLEQITRQIGEFDEALRPLLPPVGRLEKLDKSTFADLQRALPDDAVFIDLLSSVRFERPTEKAGKAIEKGTRCYSAFVVTKTTVEWIDLKDAAPIDRVISLWREAITTFPERVPPDLPVAIRDRVWDPIRRVFPHGVRTVYISPDAALTGVPWAAVPGDKAAAPGAGSRILIEDFAIAVVPHGPFLLGSLWSRDENRHRPHSLLAIGGVSYSAPAQKTEPGASAVVPLQSELPLDSSKTLNWSALPGARTEAEQIVARAARQKLETRFLNGSVASAERVVAELAQAKYAHLATHGFFADKEFRSVLQVDPKLFETARFGLERVGAGARNPMVMSGLVFAGANLPNTPGRGIITGEALIDRDLSGLELAVLSACETGLGDVADGEGVFGLQRAFHVAGTRNVVASLWQVNDLATAALMGEFYRQLWDLKQPPIEALRQAQLAVYRANPNDFKAMALRGAGKGDIKDPAVPVVGPPLPLGKTNPPALWAAFSLSGLGR